MLDLSNRNSASTKRFEPTCSLALATAKDAPQPLAVRPARLGAVRRNHRPRRILLDADRDGDFAAPRRRDGGSLRRRCRVARIRGRSGDQSKSSSTRLSRRGCTRRSTLRRTFSRRRRSAFGIALLNFRRGRSSPISLPILTFPLTFPLILAPLFFLAPHSATRQPEAAALFRRMRQHVGERGKAIIGVDLRKDVGILIAAYNDRRGVTAEFNLNLLRRINRELEGDFPIEAFAHEARWNERESAIEMHLVSRKPQAVSVAGWSFAFAESETIHTETCRKFDVAGFAHAAHRSGWRVDRIWSDPAELFAVFGMYARRGRCSEPHHFSLNGRASTTKLQVDAPDRTSSRARRRKVDARVNNRRSPRSATWAAQNRNIVSRLPPDRPPVDARQEEGCCLWRCVIRWTRCTCDLKAPIMRVAASWNMLLAT